MDIFLFVVAILAVWRAATMLQDETGPAGIFAQFRAWLAKRDDGNPGSFFDGYTCFYCLSMWLAFLPAFYLEHNISHLANFLMYWLAISAGAVILNILVNALEQRQ